MSYTVDVAPPDVIVLSASSAAQYSITVTAPTAFSVSASGTGYVVSTTIPYSITVSAANPVSYSVGTSSPSVIEVTVAADAGPPGISGTGNDVLLASEYDPSATSGILLCSQYNIGA